MLTHYRLSLLSAITSAVAGVFLSSPVWAQSPVSVEGTYRVGAKNGATAFFTKAQGADKRYSIGNTKLEALLINPGENGQLASTGVEYLIIGDPGRPNGGLFERFVGFDIPFLDLQLPTPVATGVSTEFVFYDLDAPNNPILRTYDTFQDFPKYPLKILSDANAFLGIIYIFDVDFADLGLPRPDRTVLKSVKFTLKKPGKMAILDGSYKIVGKTVITKNKIDLSPLP